MRAVEILAGDRLDADRGVLPDVQPAAVPFVEPRLEVNRRQVGQLEDGGPGPGAIARAELLLAAEHPAAAEVGQDVDHPGRRGLDLEVREPRLRALEVEDGLLALALPCLDVGLRGRSIRVDPGFDLAQPLLGVGQRQRRLLLLDARDHVPLLHVELRAFHVVARAHQRGLVLLGDEPRLPCACSISASACLSSDCFSCTVRCSVDPSNCTSTSPG
jgi:hypothetical protein